MSKNAEVPRNKDGTPDKRTNEGRAAAAVEGESNKNTDSKSAEVPRNKDGTPDKRTIEGRAAASKEGDKDYIPDAQVVDDDVPRNLDGTPDKRTNEGRAAAAVEGDSNKHTPTEGQVRLDGELDKRTVEGRQQVEAEAEKSSSKSSKDSKDSKDSGEPQFDEGDRVVFNIGNNDLHGTISRVLTKDAVVDGRVAHGSKDEPRYAVEYDGTGKEQIRTEGALEKDEESKKQGGGQAAKSSSSSSSSGSQKDDRYRKGHKFEEGETVVFHIGKHTIHGKIAKVGDSKSGEYKVKVGEDTFKAKESELEKDKEKSSSSSSSSSGSSKDSKDSGEHKFNEGDAVTFNIGLNELHGHITRVITDDNTVVDGRVAHGSKDEPRYAVEYDGTGKEQIRTEGAIKKDDEKMEEDKSNKRKREEEEKKEKDSKEKASATKEPSPKKTKSK